MQAAAQTSAIRVAGRPSSIHLLNSRGDISEVLLEHAPNPGAGGSNEAAHNASCRRASLTSRASASRRSASSRWVSSPRRAHSLRTSRSSSGVMMANPR